MNVLPTQEEVRRIASTGKYKVHISAYSLIIEEGTPFAEQNLDLPDEDTEYQMYDHCIVRTLRTGV